MRKITILLAAIMLSLSAVAQQKPHTWKITPQVGLTASKFNKDANVSVGYVFAKEMPVTDELLPVDDIGTHAGAYMFSQSRGNSGFTIGAEAQYQFNKIFGLSVGAFYAQQGVKWNLKGFKEDIKGTDINGEEKIFYQIAFKDNFFLNYNTLDIPILANFYVWKGLALKAGLEPQITLNQKVNGEYVIDIDGTESVGNASEYNLCLLGLSLPVGVSYEYNNVIFDLRYHLGLTNIENNNAYYNTDHRSQMLTLTVGYKL